MPSLHLDIPSIDWIGRPPRTEGAGRGKSSPLADAPAPAPDRERAKPPATADTPALGPWPGRPANLPA